MGRKDRRHLCALARQTYNRAGLRDGFALGDNVCGRYFTIGAKVKM